MHKKLLMLSLAFIAVVLLQLTRCLNHNTINNEQNIITEINLHEIHVPYYNHPYSKETTHHRSLLTEYDTAPIRISAYYDPETINTNTLTTDKIQNLKSTIGAIANYYQKIIRVIPINDTFYMERFCLSPFSSVYGIDCTQYVTEQKCQNVVIPEDHYKTQYLFHYPKNESVIRLGPGRGISNTDLVLYISADYSTPACTTGSTLAHGSPCITDQYGRPIAGSINVCQRFFSDHEWKYDTQTMLHELAHITVMDSTLWYGFRDSNGAQILRNNVIDETVDPPVLKTPILLQTVQEHFNCASATGLPVQSTSISHWHERYLFSEIGTPTIFTQQVFFSKFTIALMEDSGWYLPNYEYAEPYYFGKNAGCAWFIDDCIDKNTHISNFPEWYCDSNYDDGCNQDNSAPAACFYKYYYPPMEYQYFSDASKGGSALSDYCPWRYPYVITSPDYESVCWDIRGNAMDVAYMAETWSAKSRCTTIIATNGESNKGYCFEHECNEWDGNQYNSVDIVFSNTEIITCQRSDELITKTLTSVVNRELKCPNIDIVCGTNTNYDKCYWGHYSDIEGQCICNPGYTGIDCNTIDDFTNVDVIPGPIYVNRIWDNLLCVQGFTNYPNYNGVWIYFKQYDYLPVYYNENESKFLWWNYWDHKWYISMAIGSNDSICRCAVSKFTEDISLCNGNWICSSSTQTLSNSNYGSCPNESR